ncbi:MAG: hypothetical protein VW362_03345 [Candidatus Nanopelagicales bacterium]
MDASISNAIARLKLDPLPAPSSKSDLSGAEDIAYLHGKLLERERQYAALLELHDRMKQDYCAQLDAARAECESMRGQKDAAERMCAEYKGRSEGATPAPANDSTMKYEALVAEHTDLRVQHGACAAREQGLQQVIAELRRANDTLSAQVQAALTEEPEEPEETESEDTGFDVEVVRGGDDRIRTLRVRPTK